MKKTIIKNPPKESKSSAEEFLCIIKKEVTSKESGVAWLLVSNRKQIRFPCRIVREMAHIKLVIRIKP